MMRKCLVIGIILLITGTSIITAQKTMCTHQTFLGDVFGLQSNIVVSWSANQTQEPLVPLGPPQLITLDVSHNVYRGNLGRLILLYCSLTKQIVNMSIEIIDKPDYCSVTLSPSYLRFPISETPVEQHTNLTVAVNDHAPAYYTCFVKIKASVGAMFGPFGALPFVHGFEQNFCLTFIPGYLPRIVVIPASDYINVTPGNTSHLLINITNTGNGKTVVMTQVVDWPSGDWLVSIPSVVLDMNTSDEICVSVVPPSDFNGTDTITISFTPYKADDYNQHGAPVNITITVICEP
ncbi:MAG: hypothetical protein NTY91_07975 [Euryarchaeota archaeon]|jgi:hypothetical protein|nr:hypothetical protein [Euryarchaeota archaeon]